MKPSNLIACLLFLTFSGCSEGPGDDIYMDAAEQIADDLDSVEPHSMCEVGAPPDFEISCRPGGPTRDITTGCEWATIHQLGGCLSKCAGRGGTATIYNPSHGFMGAVYCTIR